MKELQDFDREVKFSGKQPRRSFGGIRLLEEIKTALKDKFPKFQTPEEKWDEATRDEWAMRLKLERNFQKKHLQAYLRGARKFSFGVDNQNKPMYFNVEENWE